MSQTPKYTAKLVTSDEWKLICQIRQAEACKRKVSYFSESEAYSAAVHFSCKSVLPRQAPSRPYKCPICTHWHLTTKPLLKRSNEAVNPP